MYISALSVCPGLGSCPVEEVPRSHTKEDDEDGLQARPDGRCYLAESLEEKVVVYKLIFV